MMRKPKQKKVHSNQYYTEKQWYRDTLKHRDTAEKKGDLSTVARLDEILAKRMGYIRETPQRQKELTVRQQETAFVMSMLWHDPRVQPIKDEIRAKIAKAGSDTPMSPPEASDSPFPSVEKNISENGDS